MNIRRVENLKTIYWFEELKKTDVPIAGGKGAQLGEMLSADFPVPTGFVVTADTYDYFLEQAEIKEDIEDILKDLNVDNIEELDLAAKAIKNMINGSRMPKEVEADVITAYKQLSKGSITIAGDSRGAGEFVAVRSSATAEDLPDASFAGQQRTLLNVKGEGELLIAVKECWASLFEPRAIFYRAKKGFSHSQVLMSVIIQKMIDSEKAGVMFTNNPINNDSSKIAIEASWGLGEAVVSGQITPDNYLLDKESLDLIEKKIPEKPFMYTRDIGSGKTTKISLSEDTAKRQVLNAEELQKLGQYGKSIEEHYNFPQDIEWAIEDNTIYILQSRPVTTLKKPELGTPPAPPAPTPAPQAPPVSEEVAQLKAEVEADVGPAVEVGVEAAPEIPEPEQIPEQPAETAPSGEVLVKGLGASPGVAAGKVKIVHDVSELSKIEKGNILVTKMTTPDMVPAMERAAAIVTNEGGTTCHAAIVSRELGIPCIVGTRNATEILKEEEQITVDANAGVVNPGVAEEKIRKVEEEKIDLSTIEVPDTKTKLYVNLGVPSKAEEVAKLPVDGVGLMREEFIFASMIGEHPLAMIAHGEQGKFIDALAQGISIVARAFNPRPVVLRLSDFKTNEYKSLKGGEAYEDEEANPMIGWRGCSRYVSEKYAPAFRLELKAVKKVRDELGFKNVWIMLPFVRTLEDVTKVAKLMEEEGLHRGEDLKLWMMAEVPSNVILADEFAKLVDGFSIGSNDLTQLIMGADRDSELLAKLGYFDERNPAVKRAIERIIKIAHENNCTVSICGQAPSVFPEFTRFLVECGIDSISANADAAIKTKQIIANEESKLSAPQSEL